MGEEFLGKGSILVELGVEVDFALHVESREVRHSIEVSHPLDLCVFLPWELQHVAHLKCLTFI